MIPTDYVHPFGDKMYWQAMLLSISTSDTVLES